MEGELIDFEMLIDDIVQIGAVVLTAEEDSVPGYAGCLCVR